MNKKKRDAFLNDFFRHNGSGNRGSTRQIADFDIDLLEQLINQEMEGQNRRTLINILYARFTKLRAESVSQAEKDDISNGKTDWRIK